MSRFCRKKCIFAKSLLLFFLCSPLAAFSEHRFLQPSQREIEESREAVFARGKEEVYALPTHVLTQFLWDRYVRGIEKHSGRLKNLDTPFYPYCYETLRRIDPLYERIKDRCEKIALYAIAAENDWLVPKESVLIGDVAEQTGVIPGKGHIFVACAHKTRNFVLQWLSEGALSSEI